MSRKTGRSDVHPGRNFHSWQVWPGSYDNPEVAGYPRAEVPRPRLDRRTPLAAIGSCFIRELMERLSARGLRFLREEADRPAGRHGSAAWERLYNLFSVRQVLEYALTDAVPAPRWWIAPQSGQVQDPYRRIVLHPDVAAAEAEFAAHRLAARRVLTGARVLLLSLDYVEIWEDGQTGAVLCLPSGPYVLEGGDMRRYRPRVTGAQENLAELETIHDLLRRANPDCRLILALSPIQQWVTFRADADVFTASFAAKAVLRAAVEAFTARRPEVSYFPAYEMALLARPARGVPVFAPGRENFHVAPEVLDEIAGEFLRWYVGDEEAVGGAEPGP